MTRQDAIRMDNAGWFCRELAFNRWRTDTVFPAAVNRWVARIALETLTTQQELDRLLREYRHG
ncbi:hypothetical protein IP90_00975 [Luteimonas cucumeris]|uniref:Uncharacterized protein n=1 Tax=Luteimonas cucumeris TaxID=985012 RepID=A0A562LB00_9GAMM|nr:hypothetical protein [Luteimonas cucumeris]TWI04837.1 hypothetical protein IP90_00975 [Luteimonas cucumeris]